MKTMAEFEADRAKKGLAPDAYQKALDDDDPEGGKLYRALCAQAKAEKSLADVTAQADALRKSLESLSGQVDGIKAAMPSADAMRKSLRETEEGTDVGQFLQDVTGTLEKSLGGVAHTLEAVAKATIATGRLVHGATEAIKARDGEITDLRKSLDDLKAEFGKLAASPVAVRGASNLADAEAVARRLGVKDKNGQPQDGRALVKSLQDGLDAAQRKGDAALVGRYGDVLSLIEVGFAGEALQRAQTYGLLSAH